MAVCFITLKVGSYPNNDNSVQILSKFCFVLFCEVFE